MGERAPECAHYRPHRRWQNLAGLRTGTQGLPGRQHRTVCAPDPTDAGVDHCEGLRPILETPDESGQGRHADPGDWGLVKLSAENRRDMLEVLEHRHGRRSTITTSQLPIEQWHVATRDATLADAILDRLVHNAYKSNLRGESMRKRQAKLTNTASLEQEEKLRIATFRWVVGFRWNGWQPSTVYAINSV